MNNPGDKKNEAPTEPHEHQEPEPEHPFYILDSDTPNTAPESSPEAKQQHHHHHHHHKDTEAIISAELFRTARRASGHHHHHHHHDHGKTSDELHDDPSLLVINPSTGKPYPPPDRKQSVLSAHKAFVDKVSKFLPGMQSLPQVYERQELFEPKMAPLPPSLMIKRQKHRAQVIDELQVMSYADHLFIRSTYEMMPFFYGVPNRYEVIDSLGQRIYFAKEMAGFWTRHSASHWKNFIISIVDFKNKEVCNIEGEPGFCQGAGQVLIYHGDVLWGRVAEELNCWTPVYDVFDGDDKLLYTIHGPSGSACYGTFWKKNLDFRVLQAGSRTQIGKFTTNWEGPVREIYTAADNFGVEFDQHLDITHKTLLLGAGFLIYFQYFEQGGGQPNSRTLYQHGRGYNRHGRLPVTLRFLLPLLALGIFISIVYLFHTLP